MGLTSTIITIIIIWVVVTLGKADVDTGPNGQSISSSFNRRHPEHYNSPKPQDAIPKPFRMSFNMRHPEHYDRPKPQDTIPKPLKMIYVTANFEERYDIFTKSKNIKPTTRRVAKEIAGLTGRGFLPEEEIKEASSNMTQNIPLTKSTKSKVESPTVAAERPVYVEEDVVVRNEVDDGQDQTFVLLIIIIVLLLVVILLLAFLVMLIRKNQSK